MSRYPAPFAGSPNLIGVDQFPGGPFEPLTKRGVRYSGFLGPCVGVELMPPLIPADCRNVIREARRAVWRAFTVLCNGPFQGVESLSGVTFQVGTVKRFDHI